MNMTRQTRQTRPPHNDTPLRIVLTLLVALLLVFGLAFAFGLVATTRAAAPERASAAPPPGTVEILAEFCPIGISWESYVPGPHDVITGYVVYWSVRGGRVHEIVDNVVEIDTAAAAAAAAARRVVLSEIPCGAKKLWVAVLAVDSAGLRSALPASVKLLRDIHDSDARFEVTHRARVEMIWQELVRVRP